MSSGKTVQGGTQSFAETFSIYLDRRMARIGLLGLISGFPWVLIGSALSLWLKEDGLSRSTIGWAGLIFGVYAINFLWAPLIDRIRIPWLTARLGHRRAWIVLMQSVILICLVIWSRSDPVAGLAGVITIGLVIAIASATQDITIDALRIEQVNSTEGSAMAAGAAVAVVGWWTGYKLGGVAALTTAQAFENAGVANYWQATFLALGMVVIVCNIALMFVSEPPPVDRAAAQSHDETLIRSRLHFSGLLAGLVAWLGGTLVAPLASFFKRNGVAIALAVSAGIAQAQEATGDLVPYVDTQLVGFTSTTVTGDAGVLGMTNACHLEFSATRMCTSEEVMNTVAMPVLLKVYAVYSNCLF